MWDERYSTDDYLYGTEPNDFLREQVQRLGPPPRRVLCLADGEGRNGVYLAGLGHAVTSVDASRVGLAKAARLAEAKGVALEILHADLTEHVFPAEAFDAVVSIFCHVPEAGRPHLHRQVARTLKPGGLLVLEAYTPDQVPRDTGFDGGVTIVSRALCLARGRDGRSPPRHPGPPRGEPGPWSRAAIALPESWRTPDIAAAPHPPGRDTCRGVK